MTDRQTRILVIDEANAAVQIERGLANTPGPSLDITRATSLAQGLELLDKSAFDAVILDVLLPDSTGVATVVTANAHAPDVPLVVLTGLDDDQLRSAAIAAGAEDYLVKGQAEVGLLVRALGLAIERHRRLSLTDRLTGVRDRRGFLALAQQELKLASRKRESRYLFLLEIKAAAAFDDGHGRADRAVLDAAHVLTETFRESDIVGRVATNQFCVLLTGVVDDYEHAYERLEVALSRRTTQVERRGPLPYIIAVAKFSWDAPCSVLDLMGRADHSMSAR